MSMQTSISVAVASAKGGVGKSLAATNLSALTAARLHLRTALVDLDAGNGIDDLLLDLAPEKSWLDLMPVLQEITSEHLELARTVHTSGLHLFAAPADYVGAHGLESSQFTALLRVLRENYQFIVLDCPSGLVPIARNAVSRCDVILFLLTPDAPCLRSTQRMLAHLPESPPLGLVLSQYEVGGVFSPSDIEKTLRRTMLGVLPIDARAVWENVHYGQPCALSRKRGLAAEYRRVASVLTKDLHPHQPALARMPTGNGS